MSFSPHHFGLLSDVWRQWWRTLISSCLEFCAIKWSASNGIKAEGFRKAVLSVCAAVRILNWQLTSTPCNFLLWWLWWYIYSGLRKYTTTYWTLLVPLSASLMLWFFLFSEASHSSSKNIFATIAIPLYLVAGWWSCLLFITPAQS